MIDKTSQIPAYEQIAAHLQQRIEEGEFDESHQLPCLKTLATQYKVSTSTTQRAAKRLASQGLVAIYPGSAVRLIDDSKPQPRRIDELTDAVARLTPLVDRLSKKIDDLTESAEAATMQVTALRKRVRALEDARR